MSAATPRFSVPLAIGFVALMIATRFHHFGTALHLPDASMALFFLGGLWPRRHLAFAAFMALAVLLDWVSVSYAGVSDFCVTPAYSFLLPAYAVRSGTPVSPARLATATIRPFDSFKCGSASHVSRTGAR